MSRRSEPGSPAACPACGQAGRQVKPITIESLVAPEARLRVGSAEGFRFCAEPSCEIAYYRSDPLAAISRSEVRVPIGQKGDGPPRPVCYCFEHSAEDIVADVVANGGSRLAEQITDNCRVGMQRCEELNPQGSCCLGTVRQLIAAAQAGQGTDAAGHACDAPEAEGCCSSGPAAESLAVPQRAAFWATGGALASAVLSSTCCWLPLLLVAFGMSAAGVTTMLNDYRPIFLGVAAVSLGLGFFFAYRPKPGCAAAGTCAVPSSRLVRTQRMMLWGASLLVLAFAFFPDYVGVLLGATDQPLEFVLQEGAASVELQIEGMSCEGCAASLQLSLTEVPGVSSARVDFAAGRAVVAFDDAQRIDGVLEAVDAAGFSASVQAGDGVPK